MSLPIPYLSGNYVSLFGPSENRYSLNQATVIFTEDLRGSIPSEGPVMIHPEILADLGKIAGVHTLYVDRTDQEFFGKEMLDIDEVVPFDIGVGFGKDRSGEVGLFYVSTDQILRVAGEIAGKRSSPTAPKSPLSPRVLSYALAGGFEHAFLAQDLSRKQRKMAEALLESRQTLFLDQ